MLCVQNIFVRTLKNYAQVQDLVLASSTFYEYPVRSRLCVLTVRRGLRTALTVHRPLYAEASAYRTFAKYGPNQYEILYAQIFKLGQNLFVRRASCSAYKSNPCTQSKTTRNYIRAL